ncbi:imidazole glycerol phosphate synthase subunit HisF [bacterium]|nr:imidazole glycerol phosphate synthase subunit HisF [bacterium]
MKRIRMIPVLLLQNGGLYKTTRFRHARYVGDPINTVKLFNEKGADEIVVLDIAATKSGKSIDVKKITEIASEAFMPMAYGGGIQTFEQAKAVFDAGYEKVVLNTSAFESPQLISTIAGTYGSQSVVISIDAKKVWWGGMKVHVRAGSKNTGLSAVQFARQVEQHGAGEIMITAIHRDGTWDGYDLGLIKSVAEQVDIPVIACGGAAGMDDFRAAVSVAGASAVAAGSFFVYQKKNMGVLISFPSESLKIPKGSRAVEFDGLAGYGQALSQKRV